MPGWGSLHPNQPLQGVDAGEVNKKRATGADGAVEAPMKREKKCTTACHDT